MTRKLDVGYYTMDGRDALWYVRIRNKTTDFDRGRRQQQLLRALLREALSSGQLAKVPELWGEITKIVETNMPFETMVGLLPHDLSCHSRSIKKGDLIDRPSHLLFNQGHSSCPF